MAAATTETAKNPRWRMVILAALVGTGLLMATAAAEPPNGKARRRIPLQHLTLIRVGFAGETIVQRTTKQAWDVEFRERRILESAYGQQELDLVGEQKSSIAEILAAYDRVRDAAWKEYTKRHFPGIEAQLYARMTKAKSQALTRIRDELLPLQSRRLDEIAVRWKIRREGLCHVLLGEWANALEIAWEQRLVIMREAALQADRLEDQMKGRRKAVLDDLFAELNPRQKEKLKQEMRNFLYGASESLDLLCHQLAYESPRGRKKDRGGATLEGIRLPMEFVVDLDGTWRSYNEDLVPLALALLQVLENERAQTAMRFTDEQVEAVEQLRSDYLTKKRERIGARYPASFFLNTPEGSVTHKAAIEWMQAQEKALRKELADDLLLLLTAPQKASLDRLSRQATVLRRGYVAAFLDGELGTRLGLTKNQKSRIAKRAERLRKRLADAMARWEQEAYDAIFEKLSPQQRAEVTKKLGRPLPNTVASLSVLIDDFRNYRPSAR